MSRSSARESDRALVEPTAALFALAVVCASLTLYTGVLGDVVPGSERSLAEPTLRRVHDAVVTAGVVVPGRLARSAHVGPRGARLNVTLRGANRTWTYGAIPPNGADAAERRVSVRVAPGRAAPGVLRVEVWS